MATETRTFESVDNSPETVAANKAYFDAQGAKTEVSGAAPTETTRPPASEQTPPATSTAPSTDPDEAELDALEEQVGEQSQAAPGSASPDGKKESSIKRVRRERRELKAANEKLEKDLADANAKITAAATPPASAAPAAAAATPSGAAAAETGAPAPVAEVFPDAEPQMPKYEDFANEDDQLLAFNVALTKHTKDWSRWDRKREAFETKAAADQAQKVTQVQQQQTEFRTKLNKAVADARAEMPDFDTVLQGGNVLSPALSVASTIVPGGLKAAYLLAKDPAKLKQFNEQTAATQLVNGRNVPTQDAYDLALYLLGQVQSLPASASPAPAATPAAALPSSPPPREEPPAPRPARGRSADEPRREDLNGDARRDRLAAELRP